jgi:hypothetical protein
LRSHRISPIIGAAYLFTAMSANMILGVLLTFSPLGYYPRYMRSSDGTGIFRLIRTVWGLDPQSDINLGGMFMWIVGGLLYFASLLAVISRPYRDPEERAAAEKTAPPGLPREGDKEDPSGWNTPKPDVVPSPSYWPFMLSVGAALFGFGLLTSKLIGLAGIALLVLAVVKWVGRLRHEEKQ